MKMCGEDADLRYEDSVYYARVEAVKEVSEALFQAVIAPSRFRRRLIKLLFPEIMEVMDLAREKIFWATFEGD